MARISCTSRAISARLTSEQVGEGLILEIVDSTGNIGIAFVVGPREHLTRLVPQFAPSVPQLVLEV